MVQYFRTRSICKPDTANWKLLICILQIHKVAHMESLCCRSPLVFLTKMLSRWDLRYIFLDVFSISLTSGLPFNRFFGIILCLAASSCLRKCGVNLLNEETRIFLHDLNRDHRADVQERISPTTHV